jgi:hypothetical protein
MYRMSLLLFTFLSLALLISAAPAAADSSDRFRKSQLPSSLRYLGSGAAESRADAILYRHRGKQFRAVEAPTRYRTKSILRYSRALGDSGLVLRVKAPMKFRKIIKVELHF